MSEKEKITKAAFVVSAGTLLSRIFGLIRDQITAYFFGTGLAADAFFVAFRIPNLLRRLLAEGALTVSFIPIFSEYFHKSRTEAFELARAVLTLFSFILVLVSLLGIFLSPWLVWAFAPGFKAEPDKFVLTVQLTRIMFPYIFLVGLVALAMGILNTLGKFAAPALSPVFLNLGMIVSVLMLSRFVDPPIISLAIGVIVGGLLQVCCQLPDLIKAGGLLGISFDFNHPAIKRIGLLMAPAALGAAAYQITVFINTLLASFLPEGSISYLYYADRIMQFPLGVFAVAMGTAVLPSMSRLAAKDDLAGLRDTLSFSLRLIFFITIPATVGMIVLATPGLALLFQRGRFDQAATQATAQALVAYAVGLPSLSAVQVMVRVFYSLKDTRTPVKIGIACLLGNVILAAVLMFPLKHTGLALASSLASIANFTILMIALRKRLGDIGGRAVLTSFLRNLFWSLVMGLALVVLVMALGDSVKSTWQLAGLVLGGTLLGSGLYLVLALAGRAPEVWALINRFRRKRQASISPPQFSD